MLLHGRDRAGVCSAVSRDHGNTDQHCEPDRDNYCDDDGDLHRNADAVGHSDAEPNSHSFPNSIRPPDLDVYTIADANRYSNADAKCHSDRNADFHTEPHRGVDIARTMSSSFAGRWHDPRTERSTGTHSDNP